MLHCAFAAQPTHRSSTHFPAPVCDTYCHLNSRLRARTIPGQAAPNHLAGHDRSSTTSGRSRTEARPATRTGHIEAAQPFSLWQVAELEAAVRKVSCSYHSERNMLRPSADHEVTRLRNQREQWGTTNPSLVGRGDKEPKQAPRGR